jgi:hypothetical protein
MKNLGEEPIVGHFQVKINLALKVAKILGNKTLHFENGMRMEINSKSSLGIELQKNTLKLYDKSPRSLESLNRSSEIIKLSLSH